MKEKWEPIFEGILPHLCAECSKPKFPSCISKIFKKYLNSQYLHYYAHSVLKAFHSATDVTQHFEDTVFNSQMNKWLSTVWSREEEKNNFVVGFSYL